MEETIVIPPEAIFPPPRNKWEREYRAYQRLLPELLKTHRGKYVAIHNEQVVDTGDDPIDLIKQVHARYGYVPIHVDCVVESPPPPVRIPHRHLYSREEPT
ncbi:MAG TPA: DUF5678 domain-containing protein [Gemmataceae bacterium]|nr:DUF5678 domain-containing protein [Gemmataceae bacterium]